MSDSGEGHDGGTGRHGAAGGGLGDPTGVPTAGATAHLLTELAALPDAELAAVLRAATADRAAFAAVRAALAEIPADAATPRPGGEGLAEHERLPRGDTPGDVTSTTAPPIGDPAGSLPGQPSGVLFPGAAGAPAPGAGGYTDSGVPTFDAVRDKVDRRFGTAEGMRELDRRTPAGRDADELFAAREQAARERLDRIRRSVRGESAD
ncbi:MAG TPA: hypothetical protein VK083_10905 [Nocardia sp.]|nr:hypothetical protein [Nocardia sp.]HLS77288.1 hypothetical protein [Nocardia sp.]